MLGLMIVSCNKDQKAVKMLDGKWKMTKFNNQVVPDANATTWTFTNCKLKTDELCDVKAQSGSQTLDYKYLVKDDGKTLIVKNSAGTVEIQNYTITSLDKSALVVTYSEGGTVTVEYTKQ